MITEAEIISQALRVIKSASSAIDSGISAAAIKSLLDKKYETLTTQSYELAKSKKEII